MYFCRIRFELSIDNLAIYVLAQVLSKKYSLTDILDEKGPQLLEVVGTEIEWKEGKNLCVKEIKKKQKAKSGKNKGQVCVG